MAACRAALAAVLVDPELSRPNRCCAVAVDVDPLVCNVDDEVEVCCDWPDLHWAVARLAVVVITAAATSAMSIFSRCLDPITISRLVKRTNA
jgi:hypothetical protein